MIAGNHDVTLDERFYLEYGSSFHNQSPQSPEECLQTLKSSPSITYLNHESTTIVLNKHPLLRTSFTVFGSPYSPRNGTWAFGYDQAAPNSEIIGQDNQPRPSTSYTPTAAHIWSDIPLDTDIVITHTPPYTHCDEAITKRRAMGCEDLRRALWRVRPKLTVCGHVHEGRGADRVRWDILGASAAPFGELSVKHWDDPGAGAGNNKISLIDLTSRGGQQPLDNDGSPLRQGHPADQLGHGGTCQHFDGTLSALPGIGTRGIGGRPEQSVRCDRRALCCRMGRRETCVVNCAIAATNWPHTGGKKFNKPIVVDLDLPVIED